MMRRIELLHWRPLARLATAAVDCDANLSCAITAGAIDVYRCRPGWCCENARCPIFAEGHSAACTGDAADGIGRDACSVATCAPKKMGTLCGACAPGHVLVGEQCEADCDGFGAGPFVFMLFLAFLAVFALLAFPHGEIVTEATQQHSMRKKEEWKALERFDELLDADGDGAVTTQEALSLLLSEGYDAKFVKELMQKLDADNSGSLDAAELYPIIVEMSREHPYTVTMDHCLASAAARGLSLTWIFEPCQ